MPDSFGQGGKMHPRGPYGTNDGDVWLMGDYFQDRIRNEKGDGWRMCIAMLRNPDTGKLEERLYSTDNPEMVAEADRGHELWVAAQAAKN
jgi:hypothetical protein